METAEKKIVVITGAASGIGEACARKMAAAGWKVVLADVNVDRAKEIASDIDGYAIAMDVADDEAVNNAAKRIEQEVGPVYGLVNSAGIIQKPLRPHALDMATWDRVQRINLRGSYLTNLVFAKGMLQRRRGSIVNIASITGIRSTPLHSYGPSKAAVISMTESLAAEWGPDQVRVNTVSPGYTLTPALVAAIENGDREIGALTRNAALQRAVHPDEIADAVLFLLSDNAAAITGVNLPVDCGWLVAGGWNTYGGLRHQDDSAVADIP